jgi:uncharacterized protein involved in cysteine biosynthesis
MARALLLAFGQLGDPKIRGALFYSVFLALAIAAALIGLASGALAILQPLGGGGAGRFLTIFGGLTAAFIAWMLFPAIASGLVYLFLDRVADAVEARHYADLPPAKPQSLWRYGAAGVRLTLLLALFNLLILPISFVPVLNVLQPVLYYVVNGNFLGREYMEVVGPRRLSFKETGALRRRHRIKMFVSGVILALLFSIPVVNLIAPIVATAFMVHIFHGLQPGERAIRARRME